MDLSSGQVEIFHSECLKEIKVLATFTFTLDTDSKQATFAGNIDITEALSILQQLTIAESVRRWGEAVDQARQTQPVNDKLVEEGGEQ